MPRTAAATRTIALVVGVEKYDLGAGSNLFGPAGAASRFVNWLLKRNVKPGNIFLFLSPHTQIDGKAQPVDLDPRLTYQPATEDLLHSFITDDLARRDGDLLFVYWAGHGIISDATEGSRRLFYADASPAHKRNLDLQSLLQFMRTGGFRIPQQVCVIDACANRVGNEGIGSRSFPLNKEVIAGRQQFVFFASQPGQPAANLPGDRSCLFTTELLNHLESDSDPMWPPDVERVARDLKARFTELHKRGRSQQSPTYFSSRGWDGEETILASASESDLGNEIRKYLRWAADRYGTIELRGIRKDGQHVVQMDLGRIYVPLEATAYVPGEGRSSREGLQARPIRLNEMLEMGRRIILTGGPGSGKSTVLLHIIRTLADAIWHGDCRMAQEELGLEGELPIPVFIPLSAYAAHLRRQPSDNGTLADFIVSYFERQHSSFDLGPEFFSKLLRDGRNVILLLDGLDEVPNESERIRIRQAVEGLVIGRDELRVVVTCRTAAYNGRIALGHGFREVRVKPLEAEHIVELVQHAYAHLYADSMVAEQKTIELVLAVRQIETERADRLGFGVQRLIDSPLLIRLLLIVHFNNQHVPAKRAELYTKATDAMLVPDYGPDEEVNEAIGRLVGGSQQPLRELVQYVAFEMHGEGRDDGREIDECRLRHLLESKPEHAPLTDDFIALTRLRGTLMEERLGQYRFIHLAFQEFLVARYLAETLGMKGVRAIVSFLQQGPMADTWWREVILLLVGYLVTIAPRRAVQLITLLTGEEASVTGSSELAVAVRMAGIELAATALLEWPAAPGELRTNVRGLLQTCFAEEGPSRLLAPPAIRASVGRALGHFGDARVALMGVDEMEFCFIPAASVRLGSPLLAREVDERRQENLNLEKPVHELAIPYDYWLGRYPVTNAQFAVFVRDGGYKDRQLWAEAEAQEVWRPGEVKRWFWHGQQLLDAWEFGPYDYGYPFNLPNHPVVGVCWFEDLAFMRWLLRRWRAKDWLPPDWTVCFPSEPEWEKAARGGLQLPEQPVISRADALRRASNRGVARLNDIPGRNFPWGDAPLADNMNAQETGIRSTNTPGCFPSSASPYGCEEMCGNTWEWTRSLWGEQGPGTNEEKMTWNVLYRYPYNATDGREILNRGTYWLRVARGGSFYTPMRESRCSFRDNGSPSFRFPWDGFRIAVLPLAALTAANPELT